MPAPEQQIVTRPEELPGVCQHLAAARRFGFDTEFVGEDTYRPRLCLIQAATEERLILIDPLSVGPLDTFWQLVTDPENEVIVHAGREETRLCHAWTGRRPGRLFDLQIAAGLVGLPYPLGHANLVAHVLNVRLPKTETLTEWRDRPLTSRQIQYAFDDVRHLLDLWRELSGRLQKLGRTHWAQEEFERQTGVHTEEEPVVEKWRRLKGIASLTRRQLAIVREVFQWREDLAQKTNRPPRTLCRDDLIVEIARRNPQRNRDLHVIRGLHRRDVSDILDAVARGRSIPPEECPPAFDREQDPPQVGLLTCVLQAALGQFSQEQRLAYSLICSSQDLRLLARAHVSGEPFDGPSPLSAGWRRQQVLPFLETLLRGEQGLRIARPGSETPFEFLNPGP